MTRTAQPITAVIWLLASVFAAGARAAAGFDHGLWLIAYLFLVGSLAQLLLWRGQRELTGGRPAPERDRFQVVFWNGGVILVPIGVLLETRLPVVIGGLALIAALASFIRSACRTRYEPGVRRWSRLRQTALIAFMTGSVFVGTALAWDTPWL